MLLLWLNTFDPLGEVKFYNFESFKSVEERRDELPIANDPNLVI